MKTLVTHLGKVLSLETKTPHMGCMPHGEFIFVAREAYYGNFGPFQPLFTKTY